MRKVLFYISGLVLMVGFIGVLGTVGSMELRTIGAGKAIGQAILMIAIATAGGIGINFFGEENKEGK